jgi:hypothetical protein
MSENISNNKTSNQLLLESRIGFWSAIGTTIASGLFLIALLITFVLFPLNFNWPGITVYAQTFSQHYWQILTFVIPCFMIGPFYLILVVCIHRFTLGKRRY